MLEADSIELLKNQRMMNATGNVRAVFPQTPAANASDADSQQTRQIAQAAGAVACAVGQANLLGSAENRARLWQNVVVQSPDEKITSASLDLYFTRANAAGGGSDHRAVRTAVGLGDRWVPGAQQISRAVATGGVTVQQGERRATAEHGEYTAADGKFVMSGGTPTIFDASEGTTTGRQLTFFLADATIIVDSENGSRTLTQLRVEK